MASSAWLVRPARPRCAERMMQSGIELTTVTINSVPTRGLISFVAASVWRADAEMEGVTRASGLVAATNTEGPIPVLTRSQFVCFAAAACPAFAIAWSLVLPACHGFMETRCQSDDQSFDPRSDL